MPIAMKPVLSLLLCLALFACNPPDTEEKAQLKPLYDFCFQKVQRDLNVDLYDTSGFVDEREHYALARQRIVAAINKLVEEEAASEQYEIHLRYLIALDDEQSSSEFYPVYHFRCKIPADTVLDAAQKP